MYAYDFYSQFNIFGLKFNYDIINGKKTNIILPKNYHKMKKEDIELWNKHPFYYNYILNKKLTEHEDCPLCFSLKDTNILVIDTDSDEKTEKMLNHPLIIGKPYLKTRKGAHIPVLINDYKKFKDMWKSSLINYDEKVDIIRHQVFETEKRIVFNSHEKILSLNTSKILDILGKPNDNFDYNIYEYVKRKEEILIIQYIFIFLLSFFLILKYVYSIFR